MKSFFHLILILSSLGLYLWLDNGPTPDFSEFSTLQELQFKYEKATLEEQKRMAPSIVLAAHELSKTLPPDLRGWVAQLEREIK